jgi:proteic killer suppression protein
LIESFKHKGLARLYENGDHKGLSADLLPKIERVLARLDVARNPEEMNLPGFRLHRLQGKLKGFYSVCVSGNWRIVFYFRNQDVWDVDLIDYH